MRLHWVNALDLSLHPITYKIERKMTKKIENKGSGWELNVMSSEEVLAFLDSKGIKYELCDTPVPVLGNKVSCGKPQDISDYMIEEYSMLPNSAVRLNPVLGVPVTGDSMIEANIEEDDWLRLEVGAIPSDGDVVMAGIDGEFLAKAFFTDDQNRHWLLPKNKKYDPILLTPDSQIRISGVVHHVTKKVPRLSYNECMTILNRSLKKKHEQEDVYQRLAKAVQEGCYLFWAASSWAVAYCVLRDCCGCEDSMKEFERKAIALTFPSTFQYMCMAGTVQRTISNHPYMRLHVDKWKENGASTRELILMGFLIKQLL